MTSKDYLPKDFFKRITDIQFKNVFLDDQIEVLKKLEGFPIFDLSRFLLRFEALDYKIRILLLHLDIESPSVVNSPFEPKLRAYLKKKNRNSDYLLPNDKITFGLVIDYIENKLRYPEEVKELVPRLKQLNKIRNDFTHNLFTDITIQEFLGDVVKGNELIDSLEKDSNRITKDLIRTAKEKNVK